MTWRGSVRCIQETLMGRWMTWWTTLLAKRFFITGVSVRFLLRVRQLVLLLTVSRLLVLMTLPECEYRRRVGLLCIVHTVGDMFYLQDREESNICCFWMTLAKIWLKTRPFAPLWLRSVSWRVSRHSFVCVGLENVPCADAERSEVLCCSNWWWEILLKVAPSAVVYGNSWESVKNVCSGTRLTKELQAVLGFPAFDESIYPVWVAFSGQRVFSFDLVVPGDAEKSMRYGRYGVPATV